MRPHVFNEHKEALVCKEEITCDNQFKEDGSILDYLKGIFQSNNCIGNTDDDYNYLVRMFISVQIFPYFLIFLSCFSSFRLIF